MEKRIVKIKTWGEMEKEFGLDGTGAINCQHRFTEPMEEYMPKNRIIDVSRKNDGWEWQTRYPGIRWLISNDMIKHEVSAHD